MSEKTGIHWTDSTWPVTTGCDTVSEGCFNCYAEKDSWRLAHNPNAKVAAAYEGVVDKGPEGIKWTGKVRVLPERLDWPLRWRKPRRVFVANMSDLWHDEVPTEFIDEVFAVMALCDGRSRLDETRRGYAGRHGGRRQYATRHVFQVLTKRPARMSSYLRDPETPYRVAAAVCNRVVGFRPRREPAGNVDWRPERVWPLPNVWCGVSVENQKWADIRIPKLLETPAAIRFLSCEPLLAPVRLQDPWLYRNHASIAGTYIPSEVAVDWVIVGGESGPGSRPMSLIWARSLVEQCRAAGVPVFMKQLGRRPVEERLDYEEELRLRDPKGGNPDEWPEELRVREYPA